MNNIKIYYFRTDNRVISLNTEQVTSDFSEFIEARNFDEAVQAFSNRDLLLSEQHREELEDIFQDDVSSAEISSLRTDDGFYIKHWISNRSFGELIDMYENGEIKKPEMQRDFVWNASKSSRLVESIVLGLPIPPLFMLEVEDNEYEIIDGYQRLTTLYNFVKGHPWSGVRQEGRNLPAKLSARNILEDIAGKSFDKLDDKYKRKIKRSTIPLLEFKQLTPGDFSSKYLIFERINTGSDKLNAMQIRKSLAFGKFIDDLYKQAFQNEKFLSLFTVTQIKRDAHVEALLRILAITDYYFKRFECTKSGIKNILDEYCERNRNNEVDIERIGTIFSVIEALMEKFGQENPFRKINSDGDYEGFLNISILESLVGILSEKPESIDGFSVDLYREKMIKVYDAAILGDGINPFSTNTGNDSTIKSRYRLIEEIIT